MFCKHDFSSLSADLCGFIAFHFVIIQGRSIGILLFVSIFYCFVSCSVFGLFASFLFFFSELLNRLQKPSLITIRCFSYIQATRFLV